MIISEVEIISKIADFPSEITIPFFDIGISAGTGFPSPALDYSEHPIDLNKELIRDKDSTFVARVTGDSMIDAHLVPGAYVIIDRSIPPEDYFLKKNGVVDMVLAVVEEKFLIKYYYPKDGRIWLIPANKKYKPLLINESHNFYIWGMVTKIIIDTRTKASASCTTSLTEIISIAPVKGYSSQDWLISP